MVLSAPASPIWFPLIWVNVLVFTKRKWSCKSSQNLNWCMLPINRRIKYSNNQTNVVWLQQFDFFGNNPARAPKIRSVRHATAKFMIHATNQLNNQIIKRSNWRLYQPFSSILMFTKSSQIFQITVEEINHE